MTTGQLISNESRQPNRLGLLLFSSLGHPVFLIQTIKGELLRLPEPESFLR
jgi:hypothetical protein